MIVVVDDYTGKPTYLYGTGALISMIVVVDDYTGKPTYLYGTGGKDVALVLLLLLMITRENLLTCMVQVR